MSVASSPEAFSSGFFRGAMVTSDLELMRTECAW
jgi:hypothetical protein